MVCARGLVPVALLSRVTPCQLAASGAHVTSQCTISHLALESRQLCLVNDADPATTREAMDNPENTKR